MKTIIQRKQRKIVEKKDYWEIIETLLLFDALLILGMFTDTIAL